MGTAILKATLEKLERMEAPIGVVGLGYVGLPLACLLATRYEVLGYDTNETRVQELWTGHDRTGEVTDRSAILRPNLAFTTLAMELGKCPLIIVAVPTPIDRFKKPDLKPLTVASRTVGAFMPHDCVVVFESTVYPGVTEGLCREQIESLSGKVLGHGFYLGYSPERVNPGDREHRIEKITKVVSGCRQEVTDFLATVYGSVIEAGVHKAPSIATAEAAKVIENTQRDINIALVNELAQIFDRIGLDTHEVLAAARTKWNFLDFRPGLVGGHCIGVDPYYLTHLAASVDTHPDVILAGRRINDGMAGFIAEKAMQLALAEGSGPLSALVMGVTFKENVPDVRNTKVADLIGRLKAYGVKVYIHDPIADAKALEDEYGLTLLKLNAVPRCDMVIAAVAHEEFRKDYTLERVLGQTAARVLIDIKDLYQPAAARALGVKYWRL